MGRDLKPKHKQSRREGIDDRTVNIPSFIVKPGQEIEVSDALLNIPDVQELQRRNPKYLIG